MTTVLVVCFTCKGEIRPLAGQTYRLVRGRPRCERCLAVHGLR